MNVTVECGCMKNFYELDPNKEKLEKCKSNLAYLKEHQIIDDETYREAFTQIRLYEIEKETKMKLENKNCCYFCDPQNTSNMHWIGVDEDEVYWCEDEGYYLENGCLYAVADDPYCGTGALKINYCPMCGRSLKKETDNAEENR